MAVLGRQIAAEQDLAPFIERRLAAGEDELLATQPVAEGLRQRCEPRDVDRRSLEPLPGRTAHRVRIHRDQKSGRDETRQRHHGQCRQDIGTQGACEQIAHLPLPVPRFRNMEHDQLGEIGELRSHPLQPLPDAADDGNNLRPGVARVQGLRERVEIGLPGDRNQAVAARDLTAG